MGYSDVLCTDGGDSDSVGLLRNELLEQRSTSSVWGRARLVATMTLVLCTTNVMTYHLASQHYDHGSSSFLQWREPLLDRLTVPLSLRQRDATLIPNASIARHIYRLQPSPEVDAAWETLAPNGLIAVTEEEVRRAGKDPELALKVPKDWGYGQNMYTAVLDGVHQVHCLDLLRKNLITNYEYYYGSHYNFTPPIFLQAHLNHCLDSLLQDLMCYADSHITFFNWVDGQKGGQPDFAVNRVCRDYNAMLDWFHDNMIPDWEEMVTHVQRKPTDKSKPQFAGWDEYVHDNLAGYDGGKPLGKLDNLPPSCTAK